MFIHYSTFKQKNQLTIGGRIPSKGQRSGLSFVDWTSSLWKFLGGMLATTPRQYRVIWHLGNKVKVKE
jgi:hypothetical protein